ncbi:uncharacterized protein [Ambystoma mexicanum]|uniref:uncharacterized protein n=1 Tax=Ambystoma mexicanum TaxID=8296 RepID=UPI0037E6FC46
MEAIENFAGGVTEPEGNATGMLGSESLNGTPAEDDPRAMERVLVDLMLGSAKLVQVSGEAAQLVSDGTEDSQASKALALSKEVFLSAHKLGRHLLVQLNYPSFEALFQSQQPLPPGHQDFKRLMLDCEAVLNNQPRDKSNKFRSANCCSLCGLSLGPYDGAPCKIKNHTAGIVGNICCHDHDDGLDAADRDPMEIRSRSPSHHKQLEALRIEENMGGTYMTQRRRSPRRSPSSSTDGLSPLVSEEEFSSLKPISLSPSRQNSTRYLNMVLRRNKPEGSDSEPEPMEGKAA